MLLKYGPLVTGAIVVSSLGLGQFDEDDLRLLEVLPGMRRSRSRTRGSTRRSGARRSAKALLEFGRDLAGAEGQRVLERVVEGPRT